MEYNKDVTYEEIVLEAKNDAMDSNAIISFTPNKESIVQMITGLRQLNRFEQLGFIAECKSMLNDLLEAFNTNIED